MTTIRLLDENGNEDGLGQCAGRGIRKAFPFAPWFTPIGLQRISHPDEAYFDGGASVGGAVIGNVVAGPIGALIGAAAAGNKKHIYFRVSTAQGEEFFCRCEKWKWGEVSRVLGRAIKKAKA